MLVPSDASNTGWGCHCPAFPDMVTRCMWLVDGVLKDSSSTKRELSVVKLTLQSLIKPLSNRAVRWATDNQNVTRILMHGSRVHHLHQDVLNAFSLCQENRVRLNVTWVPREKNQMADTLAVAPDREQRLEAMQKKFLHSERVMGPALRRPLCFKPFVPTAQI